MKTTLELVAQVDEFNKISELIDDDQLNEALAAIVKLMLNPDIPPAKAVGLIVQLEAYAAKFSMLATYYTNVAKTERTKKNVYYSIAHAIQRLVDALKYTARSAHS